MKAYVYENAEIERVLRFTPEQRGRAFVALPDTFEQTYNARDADLFWIPLDLGHVEAYHGGAFDIYLRLPMLSNWRGNEARHVAYFCSDGADPVGLPLIMFRQSFFKNRCDQNVIAWPYAVDDYGNLVTGDFRELPYDVSFVGSRVSSPSRIASFDSVYHTRKLNSFLDDSKLHWGSVENTDVGKRRKALFVKSLAESKLVLAARGGGLSSYRFFEAMSAGRVPVLVADDWELPHADLIDWPSCIVQLAERDAGKAGPILLDYLARTSDDELAAMGCRARQAWCAYLNPVVWPQLMLECVRGKLDNPMLALG